MVVASGVLPVDVSELLELDSVDDDPAKRPLSFPTNTIRDGEDTGSDKGQTSQRIVFDLPEDDCVLECGKAGF